jgi:hypothetical protein
VSGAQRIRGGIAGDVLRPDHLSRKYGHGGYDAATGSFEEGYSAAEDVPIEMDGAGQGFDGFAVDSNGDLVVVESKATKYNERVTKSKPELKDTADGEQMSEGWIRKKFDDLRNGDPEEQQFFDDLESEDFVDVRTRSTGDDIIELTNIRTEEIVYQDNPITGELASYGLKKSADRDPSIDTVDILKIGDVFKTK